ncbi:MAG: family 10 glycosylhydrolase, partial [Firmicutes bacterium]|nr:family 10 glycosylhydrolase [Bacillota bacterium]
VVYTPEFEEEIILNPASQNNTVLVVDNGVVVEITKGANSAPAIPQTGLIAIGYSRANAFLSQFQEGDKVEVKDYRPTFTKKGYAKKLLVLPSGEELPIGGWNRGRLADEIVVFNTDFGDKTYSNEWGIEFLVDNNEIIGKRNLGDTIPAEIPPYGYVISAHRKMSTKLSSLREGDIIEMINNEPSFLDLEIIALQEKIDKTKESLQKSQLKMERLDYASLNLTIKELENKLESAKKLSKTDSEETERQLSDISESLHELYPSLYESLEIETRGIWVDNFTIDKLQNREDIAEMLDELKGINVNVIFPDVYCYGDAIFPSKVVPQKPGLQFFQDGNILEVLVEEAHKRDIEVHPMVRIFGIHKGVNYFIEKRIDWIDKTQSDDFTNEDGNYWLCPAVPEVRAYNLAFLKELAENYGIDGIHLDYIRSEANFGYNPIMRELFKAEYGIDPFDIDDDQMLQKFKSFKEGFVSSFVEKAFLEIKAINPKILVSAAAAAPYGWGLRDLSQNTLDWAKNRQVDFLTPMTYRATTENYIPLIRSELNRISGTTYLYPGLGVYLYDEYVMLEQIQACRDVELTGQSVFSTTNLKPEDYQFLKDGPWRLPAISTMRDPLKAALGIVSDCIERINEFKPFIDAPLMDEYLGSFEDFAVRIANLELRDWDSRNIREANKEEQQQLEPLVNDLKRFTSRINRNAKKDQLIPLLTAERLLSDVNKVSNLLMPLLYTSREYQPVRAH